MQGKQKKIKEPVTVRFKKLANGVQSIYLDIYRDGSRKYEFLKMYLLPEQGINKQQAKIQNQNTMLAVNAIKAQRISEIINGAGNIKTKIHILVLDCFDKYINEEKGKHRGKAFSEHTTAAKSLMVEFLGSKSKSLRIEDFDVNLCKKFIGYLDTVKNKLYKCKDGEMSNDRLLSPNTKQVYFVSTKQMFNWAVKIGYIDINPFNRLGSSDVPQRVETEREYLTEQEVSKLEKTNFAYPMLKGAFLFSCFTGLRLSDIRSLTWSDIEYQEDGYYITKRMIKTQKLLINNRIPNAALQWLPSKGNGNENDIIFQLAAHIATIDNQVKRWVKSAGINKSITFHSARHTFATMLVTEGADLYTIKELLGHRQIETTQIYAKIVNKKKDNAVKLLDKLFKK